MIAASREFVCVRPQTFEDAAESKFLLSVFAGRNELQNTVFALLDSDGKKLSRGSRSPEMTFKSVERFVEELNEVSSGHSGAKKIEALPVLKSLRLALNVSAADLRPLVVIRGKDAKAAEKLSASVASIAWSKEAIGRFHYVVLSEEVTQEGLTPELGVSVVQPEVYGRGGEILARVKPNASSRSLSRLLADGLEAHDPPAKDYERHVRNGRREEVRWETETSRLDGESKGEGSDDPE